jgi:DNA-binding GntR family transcriptional regulator
VKGFKPRPIPKPDRTPAASRVYNELRRRILQGELAAGTLVNEIQSAEDLGVSRTPVREALRELLNDGLLYEGPRRQCVVAEGSPELDREVRLMRVALETLAVREAAVSHDPDGIDVLRLNLIRTSRALAANQINEALDCDDEFHLGVAQIAGLPLIADTVHRLRGLARLVGLSRGWSIDELQQSVVDHEAIIEAIHVNDPDAAESALLSHLT